MMNFRAANILLVEDDENDLLLMRRHLQICKFVGKLQICSSVKVAIAYLKGEGEYGNRAMFPFPQMLILDLQLPEASGLSVLKFMQLNPRLKVTPTIVFAADFLPANASAAFEMGAHSFLGKVSDSESQQEALCLLFDFWSENVVPSNNLPDRA